MRTFKPLRLRHLPYILLHKTQWRSLEQPPRHVKVPLPLYFPYGNTEGECKSTALPFAEKLRGGGKMRPTFLPCVAT